MLAGKRQFGRYFTTENPFEHAAFLNGLTERIYEISLF